MRLVRSSFGDSVRFFGRLLGFLAVHLGFAEEVPVRVLTGSLFGIS